MADTGGRHSVARRLAGVLLDERQGVPVFSPRRCQELLGEASTEWCRRCWKRCFRIGGGRERQPDGWPSLEEAEVMENRKRRRVDETIAIILPQERQVGRVSHLPPVSTIAQPPVGLPRPTRLNLLHPPPSIPRLRRQGSFPQGIQPRVVAKKQRRTAVVAAATTATPF